MIIGIIWAVAAAILLGIYALPSKYIKGYEVENTLGGFWFLAMIVVPVGAKVVLVDGSGTTCSQVSVGLLAAIITLSLLWGIGSLLWVTRQ